MAARAGEAVLRPPAGRDVDVVVVGAGGAGLAAAVTAHDAGASVMVVEAAGQVGGSTALSGGAIMAGGTPVQRAVGIDDDSPDEFFDHYLTFNRWQVEPAVVRRFCDEAPATLRWLTDLGVEFRPEDLYRAASERVPRSHRPTGGGRALVDVLHRACRDREIDIALGTRVEAIDRQGDAVTGVAAGDQELSCGAVVLATGGFSHDAALLARHLPDTALADGPIRSPAPSTNVGDGLRMGMAAGAATAGHNHGVTILSPGILPDIEPFLPGWLVFVDGTGERYVNEAAPYLVVTPLTVARGGVCWVLFDEAARASAAPDPASPWGAGTWVAYTLLEAADRGRIVSAPDVVTLAGRISVPPASLTTTLDRYNESCRHGRDDLFFKDPSLLKPVASAPFYAVRMRPSVVPVTGFGLRIDADGRVLRASDHRPLPGLFAAGEVTGNVLGPQYLGGGNAITSAVLFGRVAGATAARELAGSTPAGRSDE